MPKILPDTKIGDHYTRKINRSFSRSRITRRTKIMAVIMIGFCVIGFYKVNSDVDHDQGPRSVITVQDR